MLARPLNILGFITRFIFDSVANVYENCPPLSVQDIVTWGLFFLHLMEPSFTIKRPQYCSISLFLEMKCKV